MTPPDINLSHRRLGFVPLLAPTWLVLGLLFLVPLALIFLISFARSDGSGGVEPIAHLWDYVRSGAAFENYARSLQPRFLQTSWRSLWMAGLTTALCLLIGYPVAYFIAVRAAPRWRAPLLVLIVVPFWTSFLIRTYAWMTILRREGLINQALLALGAIDAPLDLLYNDFAVMVGLVYGELPFMVLPLYASLEKLDRSLLEAADDLGASPVGGFWRVTFPLSAPGVAAGTVLVFIPSLGQFVVSDVLGGAKTTLVGNLIHSQFAGTMGTAGDKPFGAAVAFELTAVVLLMLFAYAVYVRRRGGEAMV